MFRFSIREWLLVMIVLGLCIAWGLDRWRLMTLNTRLELGLWATTRKLDELGYTVEKDKETGGIWIYGGP